MRDVSASIGQIVKDVYGRDVGMCIGYCVDLAGQLSSIGVDSGDAFNEFSADCIVPVEDGLVIMPEWKRETRRFGLDKGVVHKRQAALDSMFARGDISRKTYEGMTGTLEALRTGHEAFVGRLVKRIGELEDTDQSVARFLATVKVQGATEELGETEMKWTTDYCVAIKAMNEAERIDITNALDLVTRELGPPAGHRAEAETTGVEQDGSTESGSETVEAPAGEELVPASEPAPSLRSLTSTS